MIFLLRLFRAAICIGAASLTLSVFCKTANGQSSSPPEEALPWLRGKYPADEIAKAFSVVPAIKWQDEISVYVVPSPKASDRTNDCMDDYVTALISSYVSYSGIAVRLAPNRDAANFIVNFSSEKEDPSFEAYLDERIVKYGDVLQQFYSSEGMFTDFHSYRRVIELQRNVDPQREAEHEDWPRIHTSFLYERSKKIVFAYVWVRAESITGRIRRVEGRRRAVDRWRSFNSRKSCEEMSVTYFDQYIANASGVTVWPRYRIFLDPSSSYPAESPYQPAGRLWYVHLLFARILYHPTITLGAEGDVLHRQATNFLRSDGFK